MIFTDPKFLVFFSLVFAVYWALRSNLWRKIFLLAASYSFYAMWDWRFLSLIGISTVIDFVAGQQIERSETSARRKAWLLTSLLTNLGLLGVFKYFGFFADSLVELTSWLGWPVDRVTLDIVLPVGISFYTFQSLSYTIDIYRGKLKPTRRVLDFALFVGFFPQLVAGPIVRAGDFLGQLLDKRVFSQVDARACLVLFLVGFFKKACVADNVAAFVDTFFATPSLYSCVDSWRSVCLYSIQIYCDFSGYSDMAIAAAGLLGYRLRPNFDTPYFSCNITEFWHRWHISLSSWLRDYLYIPLGGNRRGTWLTHRNVMITMLLGGLWHGASWNFVLWGVMHGVVLCIHRLIRAWPVGARLCMRIPRSIGWALTMFWVTLAWVPFRAEDLNTAIVIVSNLFSVGIGGGGTIAARTEPGVWWLIGLLFLMHYVAFREWHRRLWHRLSAPAFAASYGAAWSVSLSLMAVDHQPYIYFQF